MLSHRNVPNERPKERFSPRGLLTDISDAVTRFMQGSRIEFEPNDGEYHDGKEYQQADLQKRRHCLDNRFQHHLETCLKKRKNSTGVIGSNDRAVQAIHAYLFILVFTDFAALLISFFFSLLAARGNVRATLFSFSSNLPARHRLFPDEFTAFKDDAFVSRRHKDIHGGAKTIEILRSCYIKTAYNF